MRLKYLNKMDKYTIYTSTELVSVMNHSVWNISDSLDQQLELERLNNEQVFRLLPSIIYTSLLMLIGTPGNGIVLYIYFFKWRKSTSRMFILFLAALDLLNCMTTLPLEIFSMRYSFIMDMPWLCKTSRFATFTMNSASAAILVAIAIDRYKRICRPWNSQFSASQSKYICIGCIMFALLLTWPAIILYGTRYINLGRVVGTSCLLQNRFDTSSYPYVYFIIMMGSTVIIFTILTILYYFVGVQIYRHGMFKQKLGKRIRIPRRKICTRSNSPHSSKGTHSGDSRLAMPLHDITVKPEEAVMNRHTSNSVDGVPNGQIIKEDNSSTGKECKPECVNDNETIKPDQLRPLNSPVACEKAKNTRGHNGISKKISDSRSVSTEQACSHCVRLKIRIGKSTLMLFLITLVYIISFLPYYALAIIRQNKGFERQLSTAGYMAFHLFLRSYQLSSAINPIIYSFCNSQFRTFVRGVFRRQNSNY